MFKKNLRKYCKSAGTSQAALARSMGMTRQRLSRIINTPYRLSLDHIEDMAAQLGCSLADLLGYDEHAQRKLDELRVAVRTMLWPGTGPPWFEIEGDIELKDRPDKIKDIL